MKRLEVEPRSPEWHEIRSETWTASTAAVLVARDNAILLRDYAATKGVTLDIEPLLAVGIESYYGETLWKAWAAKWGRIPRFNGNADTERGVRNEERVIRIFEEKELMLVAREVTALSSRDPWMLASFDALAPSSTDPSVVAPFGFPVEAKCPAFQSRKKLWDSRKAGRLAVMGLPYYWCQVQQQIAVAEAPYGWFVAAGVELNKDGVEEVVFPLIEKVPRDDAYLKAYVAAAKFYHSEFIEKCLEPPKLPIDHQLLDALAEQARFDRAILDNNHEAAVEIYLASLEEEKAAALRRKELEAKVLAAAASIRAEGSDVVLLADRLEVAYSTPTSMSWEKVAKALTKELGWTEVPQSILDGCTSKGKERQKLKEVV